MFCNGQINELQERINDRIKGSKKRILSEYSVEENDFQTENVSKEIDLLNSQITDVERALNKLEIEENTLLPQIEELVNLHEQKVVIEDQIKDLYNQEEIIQIAISSLKEAYEEMKTNITPIFTERLSESIEKISNGKYKHVTINDEKGMIIENENGEYIDINNLSTGTIDELYLSLRLSMINDLSNESMPIILDETFAYFDPKRLESTIKFLVSNEKKHQIIILTCTDREIEALNNLHLKYNLIAL